MSMSKIAVSLVEEEKWKKFHPNTEMVTKKNGRLLFPHLAYAITGLNPRALFAMQVYLERVDKIKYTFGASGWKVAGKGDPILPIQYVQHPSGSCCGEKWMTEGVSFDFLKITHDPENTDPNMITVQTMHKYQPVLTVRRIADNYIEEFRLQQTQFIVVTAYQNNDISKLKISYNKFASSSRSDRKRANSGDKETQNAKRRHPAESSSTTSSFPTLPLQNQMTLNAPPALFYQFPPAVPMMNPFSNVYAANYNNFNNLGYYGNSWIYGNQQSYLNMPNWYMNQPPMTNPTVQPPFNPFMYH